MARQSRVKVIGAGAWYHLVGKVSAEEGQFPLARPGAMRKLVEIVKYYATGYYCDVASFAVLGNHYHLVLRFEEPRPLSDEELHAKAEYFYSKWPLTTAAWGPQEWGRFARRLFDVSEFMRNVQMAYARWHNGKFRRKGRLWADRFKSVVLDGPGAVLDCMLYVDLNPVRAGLVERPEEWTASSIHLREIGQGGWLVPLTEVLDVKGLTGRPDGLWPRKPDRLLRAYLARLYYRGAVPTRAGQAAIPEEIVEAERARGFGARGVYLKQLRYFTDGLVLGAEDRVRIWLTRLRAEGRYERRLHPIPHPEDTRHFTAREQRTHFIPI